MKPTVDQLTLFIGNQDVYADESGGFFKPCPGHLSSLHLEGHLAGTQGPYGFYLMNDDHVSCCCWDFDDHEENDESLRRITQKAKALVNCLKMYSLKPCIERSKGGRGYHVWLFFEKPQPAWKVRVLAQKILDDPEVEFFPKQDTVRVGGLGNLVRLPGSGLSEFLGGTTPVETPNCICEALYEELEVPVAQPIKVAYDSDFEADDKDLARARKALRHIPPEVADDYHLWIKVGQALHATSDELFDDWNSWSEQSAKYDAQACVRKWETFHATEGGVGFGTLYHMARTYGDWDKYQPEGSNFISISQAVEKADSLGPPTYIPTGIEPLDDSIQGPSPGDLVIVGGRPNHGKSAFGMALMESAAAQGYKGLFVSIEMSDVELARRSQLHQLPQGIRDNIFLVESRANLKDVEQHILTAIEELGVSYVCLDYVQLVRGEKGSNRYQEVSDTAAVLKQICRDHGVTIVALSQLKRAVSERDSDQTPRSSDLSESGGLENAADLILLLWYPCKEDNQCPRDLYQIFVTKRRNGSIGNGIVDCYFYADEQRFGGRWTFDDPS